MDLRIPHPDDANFPRLLRGDEDMAKQLDLLREWPDAMPQALTMASGFLRAGKSPPIMAAAVLVALMTLYPETDFST